MLLNENDFISETYIKSLFMQLNEAINEHKIIKNIISETRALTINEVLYKLDLIDGNEWLKYRNQII